FCCLGTTMKKAGSREQFYKVDFSYPFELAKLSLRNGSQQFNIITASGANSKSMFYYNKVKGKVEAALCELEFQNINIFRPSLLLGHRREQRIGEQFGASLAKVINPMLIGGIKKYRAIQAEVVARAMINVSGKHMKGIHVLQSDVIQEFGQI
ncbi:MAG: oxidoreductase, partial [Cyclobacteriaceae bacterium]|nr:oxidoreductase [Cyclobacteriaceae bacterium]